MISVFVSIIVFKPPVLGLYVRFISAFIVYI